MPYPPAVCFARAKMRLSIRLRMGNTSLVWKNRYSPSPFSSKLRERKPPITSSFFTLWNTYCKKALERMKLMPTSPSPARRMLWRMCLFNSKMSPLCRVMRLPSMTCVMLPAYTYMNSV